MIYNQQINIKRAFTLIEVLVAMAIGVAFMVGLYTVYQAGIKSVKRTSNKSEAVQGAYILYQTLQEDVQTSVYDSEFPVVVHSSGGTNNALTMHIYDPDASSENMIRTKQISYVYNPTTMQITRNGKLVTRGKFESLEFEIESSATAGGILGNTQQLLCIIKAIGRHTASRAELTGENAAAVDRVSLIAGFNLNYKAQRELFPTWNMNPSSYAR